LATLAVRDWIEHQTGWSIKKFVRTARRYRIVQIRAGQQTLAAADPLPNDLYDTLAKIKSSGSPHCEVGPTRRNSLAPPLNIHRRLVSTMDRHRESHADRETLRLADREDAVSDFKLNLPTDIPWTRVCVTEDMVDRNICDGRAPAKWNSSLAVFKYRPQDEDQIYDAYTITYLRVTATITGYQPLDKEIQGQIDWNGVNVSTVPGLTDLLNSYNPCTGAILQVSVAPQGSDAVPIDQYPFFLDFEPQKRELYELATDTGEKQSRSINALNVTKSAGATQSAEILDVDMGGGGGSGQASFAGTGAGFSYQAPNGQWGTKRLNADESLSTRSSDVATEKRETFSHTTQISQMYHLLDSYHLGTNRAVFFIQPRPHTLEEPSGFVRGPRPVEGIQEFFLVVAQPKQQDFCVSLRLDTSHLTTTAIMDYDRRSEPTSIASASAPIPTRHDIQAENVVGAQACFGTCWDVHYQCYRTDATDNVTYSAPAGYQIAGYDDLINDASHGTSDVVVTPDQQTLNINASAHGHNCFKGGDVCVNCPDTVQQWPGHARRQVQVNLMSTTPTQQVGETQTLLITTRGLCCCGGPNLKRNLKEGVVGIKDLPADLLPPAKRPYSSIRAVESSVAMSASVRDHEDGPCAQCAEKLSAAGGATQSGYSIRQANALSDHIRVETLRNLNDPYAEPQQFIDTDFFADQLQKRIVQTKEGRALLQAHASTVLPETAVIRLAEHLRWSADALTVGNMLTLRGVDLARATGLAAQDAQRARLTALGVAFRQQPPPAAQRASSSSD
jgi:hypothetical protein